MEKKNGSGVVRVATLNLWGRRGAWTERRSVLIEGFRQFRPDLVAFQEAIVGDGYDQVTNLLGPEYHVARQASHRGRHPAPLPLARRHNDRRAGSGRASESGEDALARTLDGVRLRRGGPRGRRTRGVGRARGERGRARGGLVGAPRGLATDGDRTTRGRQERIAIALRRYGAGC